MLTNPRQFRGVARFILIASLLLLFILGGFESLPLFSDESQTIQQVDYQALISQRIAKDALLLQYMPATGRVQAITELQNMVDYFEKTQAGLSAAHLSPGEQTALTSSNASFTSIDIALKSILAHTSQPVDPVEVQVILRQEPSYFASMIQTSLLLHDEQASKYRELFGLETLIGLLLVIANIVFLVLIERGVRHMLVLQAQNMQQDTGKDGADEDPH